MTNTAKRKIKKLFFAFSEPKTPHEITPKKK